MGVNAVHPSNHTHDSDPKMGSVTSSVPMNKSRGSLQSSMTTTDCSLVSHFTIHSQSHSPNGRMTKTRSSCLLYLIIGPHFYEPSAVAKRTSPDSQTWSIPISPPCGSDLTGTRDPNRKVHVGRDSCLRSLRVPFKDLGNLRNNRERDMFKMVASLLQY